jgi:hypothetical protein
MIPKIAYFHWAGDGPPMSWLRTVSVISFAKLNPEWEIRIIRTPKLVRNWKLACYGNEADCAWWMALAEHGGFQVATDIVFFKPVPEEWLVGPMACNTNGLRSIQQFAMLGCEKDNPFMAHAARRCEEVFGSNDKDYQAFGTTLLKSIASHMGQFTEIPMSALCHYDHNRVGPLWNSGKLDFPEEAIGIHWYGGHVLSKQNEPHARSDSGYALTDLARSVMP